MNLSRPCHQSTFRGVAILLFLLMAIVLSNATAFAQTGYDGIFGGGPFYKNASNNITEIENSGFTEAIVWSVEVNSVGDLNLNGEFPLTSGGVYVGNLYYPNFASDMATLKLGKVKRVTFSIASSNIRHGQDIPNPVHTQGTRSRPLPYKDLPPTT